MKIKFLLMIVSLFSVPSYGNTCDSKTIEKIDQALKNNKQVMILAWTDNDKCKSTDEACGDWVDRLNKFTNKQGKLIEVIKLAPKTWKQVFALDLKDVPLYSELFIMKDRPSYLYKGPIVETEVYLTVLESWADKPFSAGKEFLPEKVTVSFCK